jgi:hypothetical protein
MGSHHTETGRETSIFPFGEAPFSNRVCFHLGINTYTLKGKGGSVIDFMALTMIDPASSWFKILELPLVRQLKSTQVNGRESLVAKGIFDKSSDYIAQLVNKFWLSRYPRC